MDKPARNLRSPIMDAREIASLLPSGSVSTVRHLWATQQLPSHKVGRRRVSTRDAVAKFLHVEPSALVA